LIIDFKRYSKIRIRKLPQNAKAEHSSQVLFSQIA